MCGKDLPSISLLVSIWGSPPHVREGRKDIYFLNQSMRITPACAGRTSVLDNKNVKSRDHPRMCGKDLYRQASDLCPRGSPPHVREGLESKSKILSFFRITPACAGRTLTKGNSIFPLRDHPRMCGKDIKRSRILQCFILTDPVISLLSPKVSNKFPHRPMLCAALFRQFHTLL